MDRIIAENMGVFEDPDRPRYYHVICSRHKIRNIVKKAKEIGLSTDTQQMIQSLAWTICTSPIPGVMSKALDDLKQIHPSFTKYVEKYIEEDLHRFARSKLKFVPCLGYQTTAPAESMNHMLKNGLPDRFINLWEIREHCSIILSQHRDTQAKNTAKRESIITIWEAAAGVRLSPKICNRLHEETKYSENLNYTENEEAVKLEEHCDYTVFEKITEDFEIQIGVSEDFCFCGLRLFEGIPCAHVIGLRKLNGSTLPVDLIDDRWKMSPLPEDVQINQRPFIPDLDEDDDETIIDHIFGNIEDQIIPAPPVSDEKSRFNKLFFKAKLIIESASRTSIATTKCLKIFDKLIGDLKGVVYHEEEEAGTNIESNQRRDVTDVHARQPGRPKRSAHFGQKTRETQIDQSQRNKLKRDIHCSICGESGHNSRSCTRKSEENDPDSYST
jgi:hypothetical protein